MKLEKFSFGLGDRFAHQGEAQLKAVIKAKKQGVDITPNLEQIKPRTQNR